MLLLGGAKATAWAEWYDEAVPAADALYEVYLGELRKEGPVSGRTKCGHTKWSVIRDRLYAEDPAMAERVAAIRAREASELSNAEAWEIELQAEPVGDIPSDESLREELAEAVRDGAEVLDADIDVHVENPKLVLLAVLVLAVVGLTESSKRFAQAGKRADALRLRLRLRLEDYGAVVAADHPSGRLSSGPRDPAVAVTACEPTESPTDTIKH